MNLEKLYERRTFGIKPGLQTISDLLEELGNPQKDLRIVHVAGTNGKGSTAKMISSVLQCAGVKTGLYTSPHLVRLTERFQINGEEMPETLLDELLGEVLTASERLEARGKPAATFFEITTAVCLLWFRREGVKLAVCEVGMGGRLDATNVLTPLVSVITRIGMDHMQYLGDTIEKIAGEKAGIVKPNVPVVLAAMPQAARAVILAKAADLGAPAVLSEQACGVRRIGAPTAAGQKLSIETPDESYGTVSLPLGAAYQLENVATAVSALETLGRLLGIAFPKTVLRKGLEATRWPGRFQFLSDDPVTILDGGHNPDAANGLVASLKAAKLDHGLRLVVGQCADKEPAEFLRILAPLVSTCYTVPLTNPRGLPPERLAEFCRGAGLREVQACATLREGLDRAQADARAAGRPLLICGSLFLVGDVLACGV